MSDNIKSSMTSQEDASESLYSRQLLVLGPKAHKKLSTSRILIISINGLSQEIAKNLVLAGANVDIAALPSNNDKLDASSQAICDNSVFDKSDCLTAYYGLENQKKNKIAKKLEGLNHFVRVNVVEVEQILKASGILTSAYSQKQPEHNSLSTDDISQYSLVIVANIPLDHAYKLNAFLRTKNVPMIVTEQRGFSGFAINDFIKMRSINTNGESCKIGAISKIEKKDIQDIENDEVEQKHEDIIDETLSRKSFSLSQEQSESQGKNMINHVFTTVERHNLECGNLLIFSNRVYRIKTLTPFTFAINTDHEIDGEQFEEVKEQKCFEFLTIKESVQKKIDQAAEFDLENLLPSGYKLTETSLMAFYESLGIYTCKYGDLPGIYSKDDCTKKLNPIFHEITKNKYNHNSSQMKSQDATHYSQLPALQLFSYTCQALFQPVISIIGGFVAQEALKCVSEQFTPSQDVFLYDCSNILNFEGENSEDYTKCALEVEDKKEKDQYEVERMAARHFTRSLRVYDPNSIFTSSVFHHLYILFLERTLKILTSNVFLVGSGAIGCEHLKNLYCKVTITDMDTIEESNLNRQFLFRKPDIGCFKSVCAANSIMNTRNWWYTDDIKQIMFDHYRFVLESKKTCSSQTNAHSRSSIEASVLERLSTPKIPVTQATVNCDEQTQSDEILSNLEKAQNIQSYTTPVNSSTENIFSDKFLKSFSLLALALDNAEAREYMDSRSVDLKIPLFDSGTLGTKGHTQTVLPFLTESYGSSRDPPEKDIPLCTIRNFPHLIEHCVEWGLAHFNELFVLDAPADVGIILEENNEAPGDDLDAKIRGSSSVSPLKKIHLHPPQNLQECSQYAKDLLEFNFNTTIVDLITLFPRDHVTEEGLSFWEPPKKYPRVLEEGNAQTNNLVQLFLSSCTKLLADVWLSSSQNEKIKKNTIVFEKDLDSNQHINFIYAASNLRAFNYRIKETTRLEVKRLAGRIIPAIATTTAVISGLSCVEMYRYMLNYDRIYGMIEHTEPISTKNLSQDEKSTALIKLIKYRIPFKHIPFLNTYINLALPFTSFSEPMAPFESECTIFKCKFNLWDEMVVRNCTVRNLLEQSQESNQNDPVEDTKGEIDSNNSFNQSVYLQMPPSIDMISLNDRLIFCSWSKEKYEKSLDQMLVNENEGRKRLDILFEEECMECVPMWIVKEREV
ncbi:ubiquitin-activating enzyme E1 [Pseudoloma neurophilia]|uniref:Ubiquitin-activating enzyme E1 n=1 Tax=Pseudoloma neurophilia TaxID=146866 RepID=A0A0R0M0E3_9MICR|nr:ubiquitin-activating enzyme E1 [Pseudoloma neurophilia]